MSERAREEAEDARRRQRELEVLYGLSRELLQTENVARLLNAITPAIMLVTRAEAVVLYLLEGDRRYHGGREFGRPDGRYWAAAAGADAAGGGDGGACRRGFRCGSG